MRSFQGYDMCRMILFDIEKIILNLLTNELSCVSKAVRYQKIKIKKRKKQTIQNRLKQIYIYMLYFFFF